MVVPRAVHGKQLALVAVLAPAVAAVVVLAPAVAAAKTAPVAVLAVVLAPAPVVNRVVQNPLLPRVDHPLARALAPVELLAVAVLVEQRQLTQV